MRRSAAQSSAKVRFYPMEMNTGLRMEETELDNVYVLDFISIKATPAGKTIMKYWTGTPKSQASVTSIKLG